MMLEFQRVGFVATRVCGTDGVSLEIGKWAQIIEASGRECCYICGEADRPAEQCFIIPEAELQHPEIREIYQAAFGRQVRARDLKRHIHRLTRRIKDQLYEAVLAFRLDAIIAENALTIPMNIPLGVALTELLLEGGLPCLAHHHDFIWERERFLVSCVDDLVAAAFPPPLAEIQHVVINSLSGAEFGRRTGLPYRVIPNVMDFDNPPPPSDGYADDFRDALGIADDDFLILQPTRVVRRKGIEHSIELVRRLRDPRCKLVITHDAHDEGYGYLHYIQEFAQLMDVELIFANERISHERGVTPAGEKQYSVWDAFQQADLVTYASTYEGFGNAFLEAVYYRRPIFCNRYSIYRTDIEPYGFRTLLMDGYLTDEVVRDVRRALDDPSYGEEMADYNYEVGRRFFSYDRVAQELQAILTLPRSAWMTAGVQRSFQEP